MKTIKKELRDAIVSQALDEISFARRYKDKRISSWSKNETMYYGKPRKEGEDTERANLNLGKMQGFVHTLLSKIDTPLVFKFKKRRDSDLMKADRANAMKRADSNKGDWDVKDLMGKKQAIMYGRAIYHYTAGSPEGYCSRLENVDAYDFLIDPAAGGLDMENAMFLGRGNVVKTRRSLEQGKKDKLYIAAEVNTLLQGDGNSDERNEEEIDKQNRTSLTQGQTNKEIGHKDKYKFYEWWTTYKGKRYYVLTTLDGCAIRVACWKDIDPSDLFPFWSWAAFMDLTEFWTPSYCDYVREIFMAQTVAINQMLDNAEQINKPQRAIDANAIVDPNELKYRRNGHIRLNSSDDINKVYKILETPQLKTSLEVYQMLEQIVEKESGVNADAKGMSEEDKVTIYKGNLQAANERFNLLNKSYSYGYKRFARLYYNGLQNFLTKKIAVEMTGAEGVRIEEVKKSDIIPLKDRGFDIMVESSNAEMEISFAEKQEKNAYLTSLVGDPDANQKKVKEMRGEIAGYSELELRELLSPEGYADSRLLAEADRDIETLLDGKQPPANPKANNAYKERIVDYLQSNSEYIDDETFILFENYIREIDEYVLQNTVRKANETINKRMLENPQAIEAPAEEVELPSNDVTNPNGQI